MTYKFHMLAAFFSVCLSASSGFTQSNPNLRRSEFLTLTRLLSTAKDFRVRVQAALGLRKFSNDALGEEALVALHVALGDKHPAVRQTAASSIDVIRHNHEAALKASSAETRYVVELGDMDNQSGLWGETMKEVLKKLVRDELGRVKGMAVASEPGGAGVRDRKQVPRVKVMGNLVRVVRDRNPRDTRIQCEVTLTLIDEKHNTLKGQLKGVATGIQPSSSPAHAGSTEERRVMLHALYAAVRSAVSRLPVAMDRLTSATL